MATTDAHFAVVEGVLIRFGRPRSGKDYEHICELAMLEEVAHTIDDLGGKSFTGEDIVHATDLPYTQVYVALALLYDRGIVESVRGRKKQAASADVYTDAMLEYWALREKPSEFAPGESALGGEEA